MRQAAPDQDQPSQQEQQRATGANQPDRQVPRFEQPENRRPGKVAEHGVADDVDQAAQAHRRQEHAVRNAEDAAPDCGQNPQAGQQAAQYHGDRAVTLELSFSSLELLGANANEGSVAFDDASSAAA